MKTVQIGTEKILINKGLWKQRVLVGTPVTGLVRIEWVQARYNQLIPTNWTLAEAIQYIGSNMPMRFQVSDAENLIVKAAIEKDVEWLWFIEHDNVLPGGTFVKMNKYMRDKNYPVISGIYFTKSVPPEPLIYRGYGNSYFTDWKLGDKVMVDGIPMGCTLIHMSIIRAMWNESPEYMAGGQLTRRVFEEPEKIMYDPQKGGWINETGTSDLNWCKRVIEGKYLEKAGWSKFQKMKYPYLCDTSLFLSHIDESGRMFPLEVPQEYVPNKRGGKTRSKRKSQKS